MTKSTDDPKVVKPEVKKRLEILQESVHQMPIPQPDNSDKAWPGGKKKKKRKK